jgi:hypothetical protein
MVQLCSLWSFLVLLISLNNVSGIATLVEPMSGSGPILWSNNNSWTNGKVPGENDEVDIWFGNWTSCSTGLVGHYLVVDVMTERFRSLTIRGGSPLVKKRVSRTYKCKTSVVVLSNAGLNVNGPVKMTNVDASLLLRGSSVVRATSLLVQDAFLWGTGFVDVPIVHVNGTGAVHPGQTEIILTHTGVIPQPEMCEWCVPGFENVVGRGVNVSDNLYGTLQFAGSLKMEGEAQMILKDGGSFEHMENRQGELVNVDRVIVNGTFIYAVADFVDAGGIYALPQNSGASPGQIFLVWGEAEILKNITLYNTTSTLVRALYRSCFEFSCCTSLTMIGCPGLNDGNVVPLVVDSCTNNNGLSVLVNVCPTGTSSGCLCLNNGSCNILGGCVCPLGFSGTRCEIQESSNTTTPLLVRSDNALVLGLAIGIPVAVAVGIVIALIIIIHHKRSSAAYTKQSNKEIKMRLNPSHQS